MDFNYIKNKVLDNYKYPKNKNTIAYRSYKIQVDTVINNITEKDTPFVNFPFDVLTDDEIVMFIHNILERGEENRQWVSNLKYKGAKYDYSNIIVKDEKAKKELELMDHISLETHGEKISKFPKYQIQKEIYNNRYNIRTLCKGKSETLNELFVLNRAIVDLIKEEKNLYFLMGLDFRYFGYILEYTEYVEDEIFELVTSMILLNDNIKDKESVLNKLKEKADTYSSCMDFQINQQMKNLSERLSKKYIDRDLQISIDEFTQSYCFYKYKASIYAEEKYVKDLLKQEILDKPEKFYNAEYLAKTYCKQILPQGEVQKIILEGKTDSRFKQKYEETCNFINSYNYFGEGWTSGENLLDIKVFYREIFNSRVKNEHIRLNAMSLVRNYYPLSSEFKDAAKTRQADIFMRNKLIRGYYRELGILKFFDAKNAFQESFTEAILKILLIYTNIDTIEFLSDINEYFLKEIRDIVCPDLKFHPIPI